MSHYTDGRVWSEKHQAWVLDDGHNEPAANTDRELWRERPGDFYADSIHVTQTGGIGMKVGGVVTVRTLYEWHAAMHEADEMRHLLERIHQLVEDDLTSCKVPGDLSHWTIEAETRKYDPHAKAAE